MEGTGLTLGEAMALTNREEDGFGNGSWFMWIIALAIIFGVTDLDLDLAATEVQHLQ
jgi:hypothetical protein